MAILMKPHCALPHAGIQEVVHETICLGPLSCGLHRSHSFHTRRLLVVIAIIGVLVGYSLA
jgi:hypothetical protein